MIGDDEFAPAPRPFVRDRIVVLGRTQAGKTTYMVRLYHELYTKPQPYLSMIAASGATHLQLMGHYEKMASGKAMFTTVAQDYFDCNLEYNKMNIPLAMFDYSGEEFTQAFVHGERQTENSIRLREHIDHACGVILLIDPQVAASRRGQTREEDVFGLHSAVAEIRSAPGGRSVPIAIVLTKCDLHERLIKEFGGTAGFCKEHLHWINRTAESNYRTFPCSAIRTSRLGLPDLSLPPENVVEPLKWILDRISEINGKVREDEEETTRRETVKRAVEMARAAIHPLPTRAKVKIARSILQALPSADSSDPLVQETSAEIDSAEQEFNEQRDSRNTRNWLLFSVFAVPVSIVLVLIIRALAR